jgi:hypothetical protein
MENRRSALPVGFIALAGLLTAFGTIAAAAPASRTRAPRRTISVTVLADSALRKNEIWKVEILRAVTDVSQTLDAVSAIVLKIKAYDYWTPGFIPAGAGGSRCPRTIAEALSLLNRHIREKGRRGSEIVVGLVPEGVEGPLYPGIADYLRGTILIKDLKSKGGIPFVLLHEICHIFGAVDLRTNRSVMSLCNPGFRIDGFTKAIIKANRLRSFLDGEFPLSEDRVPEAINLYEGRQALGLEEVELAICLGKLKEAKSGHLPSRR